VSGYDSTVPGGVQSQVRDLGLALARQGETVRLIAPGKEARRLGEVVIVPAGRAHLVPANGSRAPVAFGPRAFLATWRALSHFVPDVVHIHEPLVPGPPLAAVIAPFAPVVATFHRAGHDRLYRADARIFGRILGRRVAAATAVSRAAIETAEQVLSHRLSIEEIPNGVFLGNYSALRKEPGASRYKDEDGPLVVYLGRLEERKGVRVLMEAARGLSDEARFVIAGDGPERASLEALADPPRITVLGPPNDEEAAYLLAQADCFVAPAVSGESFGIVLLEAMAAGTAVVCSDLAGYELAAGGAAEHFRAGDAAGLSAVLSKVLGDDALRGDLVRRGVARAEECSIDEVASAYLDIYRSVARSTPGSLSKHP
jgi:phosphatidylinositol alpha-mannosyltransferase